MTDVEAALQALVPDTFSQGAVALREIVLDKLNDALAKA